MRGFAKIAAKYPNRIAASIPAAEAVRPPVIAPKSPILSTDSLTPFASILPNPVNGTQQQQNLLKF